MASVSLQSIRDAAEAKYGIFNVEDVDDKGSVALLHPMRISPQNRVQLYKLQEDDPKESDLSDAESEGVQIDRLVGILNLVAESPSACNRLLKAVSPRGYIDVAMLGEIVSGYMESQKVGEASASQD